MVYMTALGKVSDFKLLKIQPFSYRRHWHLSSFTPDRLFLNPGNSLATEYGSTNHCPFSTIKANSTRKKGTFASADLCGPLSKADLHCPYVHFYPNKTTGPYLCCY